MIFFYILVATMPLVRHSLWSDFVGDLTLNKYLGLICLGVAVFHLASRSTPLRLFHTVQARLFVLFAILTIGSFLIAGPNILFEVSPAANFISFLLLFPVTLILVDSISRLRWVLLSVVGGVAFASLHLIREWQNAGMAAGIRPGWVTGDPNYFALSAVLCLPLALLLTSSGRTSWERRFYLVCLVVTLLAFTLAASRGGLIGLVTSFVIICWRSQNRIRYLTLGGVLLGILLLASPSSPLTRLLHPGTSDQVSTTERTAIFRAGIRMFEANLWTGVGVGNYKRLVLGYSDPENALTRDRVAHNTYVEVASELGIIGLFVFVGTFFFSLRSLRVIRSDSPGSDDSFLSIVAYGIRVGLLGALVTIFFISSQHVRLLWFMVFLSVCVFSLASRLGEQPDAKLCESESQISCRGGK